MSELKRETWGHRLRISNGTFFGQIRKEGPREWHAEIRECESGDLRRFAGVWNRKRDAVEEVEYLLNKPEYQSRG